jgi:hypothetical protein
MTRQANTQVASARPKRTPLNSRNRLSVKNKEAGFAYRIFNDEDDRISRAQEAGWELCSTESVGAIGDRRVDNASSLGSTAHFSVGKGTKAVLMRIPEDWYKEDQEVKQREIDEVENTMKNDRSRSDYGQNSFK